VYLRTKINKFSIKTSKNHMIIKLVAQGVKRGTETDKSSKRVVLSTQQSAARDRQPSEDKSVWASRGQRRKVTSHQLPRENALSL
jgi:hypothetical protein